LALVWGGGVVVICRDTPSRISIANVFNWWGKEGRVNNEQREREGEREREREIPGLMSTFLRLIFVSLCDLKALGLRRSTWGPEILVVAAAGAAEDEEVVTGGSVMVGWSFRGERRLGRGLRCGETADATGADEISATVGLFFNSFKKEDLNEAVIEVLAEFNTVGLSLLLSSSPSSSCSCFWRGA
jgi:hypothetical protein